MSIASKKLKIIKELNALNIPNPVRNKVVDSLNDLCDDIIAITPELDEAERSRQETLRKSIIDFNNMLILVAFAILGFISMNPHEGFFFINIFLLWGSIFFGMLYKSKYTRLLANKQPLRKSLLTGQSILFARGQIILLILALIDYLFIGM